MACRRMGTALSMVTQMPPMTAREKNIMNRHRSDQFSGSLGDGLAIGRLSVRPSDVIRNRLLDSSVVCAVEPFLFISDIAAVG